jgi:hypothetical protein
MWKQPSAATWRQPHDACWARGLAKCDDRWERANQAKAADAATDVLAVTGHTSVVQVVFAYIAAPSVTRTYVRNCRVVEQVGCATTRRDCGQHQLHAWQSMLERCNLSCCTYAAKVTSGVYNQADPCCSSIDVLLACLSIEHLLPPPPSAESLLLIALQSCVYLNNQLDHHMATAVASGAVNPSGSPALISASIIIA